MSWFVNALVGGQEGEGGGETYNNSALQMLERLQNSTQGEDKRAALETLKQMAPHQQKAIGQHGMELLVVILQNERHDVTMVKDTLEILVALVTPPDISAGPDADDHSLPNCGLFMKQPNSLSAVLDATQETEFYVRYNAIQFLTSLHAQEGAKLQECLLQAPLGTARLMDLLSDRREAIRTEVLPLLFQLTKSNKEIQKIIAFEGAFDTLFEICRNEEYFDGEIVIVQDCMQLVNNLLRGNPSNQKFFKEMGTMQMLKPFFNVVDPTQAKRGKAIISLALEILGHMLPADQATMGKFLLSDVLVLGTSIFLAPDLRTRALSTVARIVSGNNANQAALASVQGMFGDTHNVFFRLMRISLESNDDDERRAAESVFRGYMENNEEGQRAVVASLRDTEMKYLIDSVVDAKNVKVSWCACRLLSVILEGSPLCKKLALSLELSSGGSGRLFDKILDMGVLGGEGVGVVSGVGFLRLCVAWITECPAAAAIVAQKAEIITTLVDTLTKKAENDVGPKVHAVGLCAMLLGVCLAYVDDPERAEGSTADRTMLLEIVVQRVGISAFGAHIDNVRRSQDYRMATGEVPLDPRNSVSDNPAIMCLYEKEYASTFEELHDLVQKRIITLHTMPQAAAPVMSPGPAAGGAEQPKDESSEYYQNVLQSYKDLIRSQDEEINKLKNEKSKLEKSLNEQGALSKLNSQGGEDSSSLDALIEGEKDKQITQLMDEIKSLRTKLVSTEEERDAAKEAAEKEAAAIAARPAAQEGSNEDLRQRLEDREKEVEKLNMKITKMGISHARELDGLKAVTNAMTTNIDDLSEDRLQMEEEMQKLSETYAALEKVCREKDEQLSLLQSMSTSDRTSEQEADKIRAENIRLQQQIEILQEEMNDSMMSGGRGGLDDGQIGAEAALETQAALEDARAERDRLEQKVRELEGELQEGNNLLAEMQIEVDEARKKSAEAGKEVEAAKAREAELGSAEDYKLLLEEHNELLMCLAELELEAQKLRNNAAGENGNEDGSDLR